MVEISFFRFGVYEVGADPRAGYVGVDFRDHLWGECGVQLGSEGVSTDRGWRLSSIVILMYTNVGYISRWFTMI